MDSESQLPVINSIEQLAGKVLTHPSHEKLSENLQGKWLEPHQYLTYTIFTNGATASQSRTKAHQLDCTPGNANAAC